ncbi:hypothetical protein PC118_g355 [Phytophthora cactorum]|uniref:Uncharacterized protein n=1 Tax=Phytophthora cactorum TaxID=29920 RepID=A0A8T1GW86_9STRA|nr:hypothetical protein PC111_g7276 [Phytophthora cactorum]KAG2912133.1 hypothetical protein PC114_g9049 [Phytophthora cactorum]KAG2944991.1 hypothetical protein PC117_g8820 [Phytophthora cactorum]KAG3000203.1 hypothetical protein PC118_g355 [Phytophthora cactorum]KAG3094473.1 hypothetical protein PC122_g5747 [Phytophthora cactorum]
MVVRRETRAERQAFQDRIAGVHAEDRPRLMKEHRDFLNGTRVEDANFTSARPQSTSISDPRRPPIGKDASYLLANKQHAADTHRAVAGKAVAGSGKKRLVQKKQVNNDLWSDDDGDEDYVEEDVVEDEDDEDEAIAEQAVAAKKPTPRKASTKTTVTPTKRVVKKPRKKSSRTLAKEAREASVAAKKVAAATRRQSEVSASQRAGKEAEQAARKRLEEAGDKNCNGEKGSNKRKSAPSMPERDQDESDSRPSSSESPIRTANTTASQGHMPPSATQEAPSAITDSSASVEHESSVPDWSLDSDCDEDDEELAFLDDVEIQADPRLPPEIPVLGDTNVDAAESDVVAVDPEDVQVEGKADCDWPVLSREKLLNFAKDEVALAKMRKSGWERTRTNSRRTKTTLGCTRVRMGHLKM